MDKTITKYFCIFCENCNEFETMNESYNHYKHHMKIVYYCHDCDNNRTCDEEHCQQHEKNTSEEEGLIEMWIERFLSFQSQWIGKSFSHLFKSFRLFAGCVVCETFLRLCTHNDIQYKPKEIQWSHNQTPANETRHVCSHLRYYPFECLECEGVGKYHKKCDMNEITRHIRDCHSMALKDSDLNTLVKCCQIPKIESFMKYCFDNRVKTRHPVTKGQALVATRSSQRIVKQIANQLPKPVVVVSEPKPKRPRIETQIIVTNNGNNYEDKEISNQRKDNKNTTICSEKSDVILNLRKRRTSLEMANNVVISDNHNYMKKVINTFNLRNDRKGVSNSSAKVEIKFKPIAKNSHLVMNSMTSKPKQNNLISGDQIIIKQVSEVFAKPFKSYSGISLINKSAPPPATTFVLPKSLTLSQQFSDMMNDDIDGDDLQMDSTTVDMNSIEMKNMEFFCIFCTEKMISKDTAYHHIQRHLDYFPILCLTCGEGLTDLQSFIRHHRESHPEAVKGRYKKKEQPVLDKWISTFLYSQTTIIRSFPPREVCPVCERVYSVADVEKNKPRRCTINRKIDHLYRHISYLPYECILCRDSGQEFTVAYFESKAHSHIKLKHPEIDDNESRWQVFQKTITIPKLDEFVDNYLSQFGISMEYERRPIKKSNKYTSPQLLGSTDVDNNSLHSDNTSLNLNMIFPDLIDCNSTKSEPKSVCELNCIESKVEPEVDLMATEDNIDLNNDLNEFNNNSNDSNIVVDVCPLTLFDRTNNDFNGEEMYFCIFCPQFLSKMEAYSHYGSHLEYFPVLCKICCNKFPDVDHLMAHHQKVHSTQVNVDYQICEDQVLIKWVNEFLDSQQTPTTKMMTCSCSYNCPVCVKLNSAHSDISFTHQHLTPCAHHNDIHFSVHIHKHLNYYPYECLTCKRNGRSVRMPNLDSGAMSHLKEHNIENASMSQVVRNFPKTLVIPRLEKLIGDLVHRKRVSEKKNRMDLSPLIALQKTVSNAMHLKNRASILPLRPEPSTSTSIPRQNFFTQKTQQIQHIRLEGSQKTQQTQYIRLEGAQKTQQTKHIRLEGGRVVNLPPKTDNSCVSYGSDSDVKAINVSNISICCLHCRKYFPNRKSFKSHHSQSHPGKSILCSKTV